MPLTVKTIEKAKSKEKLYRLTDGQGLCLEVPVKGNKRWRYRYRFHGKEDTVCIGIWPEVSLTEARDIHGELRKVWRQGDDPKVHFNAKRNRGSNQDCFEAVARVVCQIQT